MRRRAWGWRLAAVAAGLAIALGLAACGSDSSSSSDTAGGGGGGGGTTLNLAYVTNAKHPYGIVVDDFVKKVNATGELTITAQPSYPQAEGQLLSDVRDGTVDMATVSSAIWDEGGVDAFQALQAPFLITNYPLAGAVEGGPIGKAMIAKANEEAGDLQVLAIHEGGLRKPLGIKPLVSPADWKGTTIRAPQSKVLAAGLAALGANVDPIILPDVGPALANGTVDGVEANLPLIYTQQWYESAKNVTGNVNLWPFPTVLTINKDKWESLTAAQQKAISDAAATVTETSITFFTTSKSTVAQDLVNCGVKYLFATDADIAALAKASEKAVGTLPAESQDFVAQIQAEKAKLGAPPPPKPLPTKATGSCVPPPAS